MAVVKAAANRVPLDDLDAHLCFLLASWRSCDREQSLKIS